MNLDHIRALAKFDMARHLNHNGVDLWTNGHILVRAKVDGSKQLDSIAKVWDELVVRVDLPVTSRGPIRECDHQAYARELCAAGVSVYINETYFQVLSEDGAEPFILGVDKPIAFRKDGILVSACMPMRSQANFPAVIQQPTEPELFAAFANSENDWYLQGSTVLRKELYLIQEQIDTKEEQVAELEQGIRDLESQADGLRKRIAEAKSLEKGRGLATAAGKEA